MQAVTTIGLDIAKSVFQVHGIDAEGKVVIRRQLKGRHVLAFFQKLAPCLIGIEACASSPSAYPPPAGPIEPCLPTKAETLPSGGLWLHEIKHGRIIARNYRRPGFVPPTCPQAVRPSAHKIRAVSKSTMESRLSCSRPSASSA
jgi:hypothetical protein